MLTRDKLFINRWIDSMSQ